MDEIIIIDHKKIYSIKETINFKEVEYDEEFNYKIKQLVTDQCHKTKVKKYIKPFKEKKTDYKFIKSNSHVLKATDEEDQKRKKIIGFLNKITTKNIETLSDSIKENLYDSNSAKFLIDQIFKNAIFQPKNCTVYVDLCLKLSEHILSKYDITIDDIIIEKCNSYLEELSEISIVDNNYDEFCENVKKKICNLGNIQLIGELYLKNLIDYKTISKIVKFLFDNTNPEKLKFEDKDYITINIQCLCNLLNSIYKNENKIIVDNIDLLRDRCNNRQFPSKARFCLMDIIDIYDKNINI